MSADMGLIRHLDFEVYCESPGHHHQFTKPLPAMFALRNTHECGRNVAPMLACYSCKTRILAYVQITCPKCKEKYSGRDIYAQRLANLLAQ